MSPAPPSVCAVIINWNGAKYLPRCLAALERSTAAPHVVVVDNASTDCSARYVREEHPGVELVAAPKNLGYAGGANAGIRATTAEYVMIMNPDVVLAPDHLTALIERLDREPSIGVAQGKLYQITPDDYVSGQLEAAGRLDSTGHAIRRTRMVYDIGQGEADSVDHQRERSIFSACGAAMLLRREMLDDLAPDGEFFDENFFAYKEDIDLCWRARLLGWDVRYVPEAVGYHVRGWAGSKRPSPKSLPLEARLHSWKNHYLLILKNDRPLNALLALPFILGWELLRQGHATLRDRAVYRTYRDILRTLPETMRKRGEIMSRRRVSDRDMRRWFGLEFGMKPSEREVVRAYDSST